MRRRRFLYAVVMGSGFAAGCIGDGSGQDQPSPTSTERALINTLTTTEEPTTSTRMTKTTTQRHTQMTTTDTPTTKTPSGENSIKSQEVSVCPPFDTSGDRTVCSGTRSEDAQVWLTVAHSGWEVDTTDDTVETNVFTFHNDSDASLRFNPSSWELHKQIDAGWSGNIRQRVGNSVTTVDPNEKFRWSFSRVSHPSPGPRADTEYITVKDDVDEGKYAFMINVPAPTGEEWITLLAVFTLDLV